MAARRLILAMLVLLVLSTLLATLVPVDSVRDESSSSTTTAEAEGTAPAGGSLVTERISAEDRKPARIELAPGDQLELTVTSRKLSDQVEIPAFGDTDDVDPDFPAHFDLLALEPGSFTVRLVESEQVIARLDVSAGQKRRGSGSSKDSPGPSNRSSDSGASSLS